MSDQMKQYEVLKWASLFLEKYNCEQGVAEILLQHHLDVSRSQFFMNMQEVVPQEVIRQFKANIREHIETGVPVQHLTGYEYFYGRRFSVNEHVLIPRPETEELVQLTIKKVKEKHGNDAITIVDVGTGSGVIAVTLALEIPRTTVYATDISKQALRMAEKNAAELGASVNFLEGDFLEPIISGKIQPDIIISNPPYISRSDEPLLSRTVKDFDPNLALFADGDGLAAYEGIMQQISLHFKQTPTVLFEIGYEQGEAVSTIIKNTHPNSNVSVIQDINENDRIVLAELNM